MPGIFGDGYSDRFFSTSRADKDSGEFLLDDADYSTSSSPQWLELYTVGVRIQYLPLVRRCLTFVLLDPLG